MTMTTALALLALSFFQAESARIAEHDMIVKFDPGSHSLEVSDSLAIKIVGNGYLAALLNGGFRVESVEAAGVELKFRWAGEEESAQAFAANGWPLEAASALAKLLIIELPKVDGPEINLSIRYSGEVFDEPKASAFSRERIADQTAGIIFEKGVYLSPQTGWYLRQPGTLVAYRMEVTGPAGYEVMSEGEILGRVEKDGALVTSFESRHPLDGIHLIAGKFIVSKVKYGNVDIMAYFFPGSEKLTDTYLEACERYLGMYEEMLGPYPFGKFAVVENFFPSGYGMPSFTLLGSQVIRLPFIVDTSLGHEVAHNWWGNSVYVNWQEGNWCEGLTTYCADYHYKELKSAEEAAEYRRNINRDYTNYVTREGDFALRNFHARHSPASRAVGYGKSMMVFHMLRRQLGEEYFSAGLKEIVRRFQWKEASWEDLLHTFADVAETDLSSYIPQWIERTGAPFLKLGDVELEQNGDGWRVAFVLEQSEPYYDLQVPVVVETGAGKIAKTFNLTEGGERFAMELPGRPQTVSVDPDCHLFRRLHREEIPPVLSQIFGGPNQLIVLPSDGDEESLRAYAAVAAALSANNSAAVRRAEELSEKELAGSTLILLGRPDENPLVARWAGSIPNGTEFREGGFTLAGGDYGGGALAAVACMRNPLNPDLGAVVLAGSDAGGVGNLGSRLLHYGKYSYLVFQNGRNIAKGTWAVESSPLIHRFDRE